MGMQGQHGHLGSHTCSAICLCLALVPSLFQELLTAPIEMPVFYDTNGLWLETRHEPITHREGLCQDTYHLHGYNLSPDPPELDLILQFIQLPAFTAPLPPGSLVWYE